MARFNIYNELPIGAWQNSCAISGRTCQGERVLDIDFAVFNDTPNGDLYVCESIVAEWARAFGFASPGEVEVHVAEIAMLKEQLADTQERLEQAQNLVSELRTFDAELVTK